MDHELLIQHTVEENIILMNNGCVCCSVRQDLIETFHQMFKNELFATLDWVVIETTGNSLTHSLTCSLTYLLTHLLACY